MSKASERAAVRALPVLARALRRYKREQCRVANERAWAASTRTMRVALLDKRDKLRAMSPAEFRTSYIQECVQEIRRAGTAAIARHLGSKFVRLA